MTYSQENYAKMKAAAEAVIAGRPEKKNEYYPKEDFKSQEEFLQDLCQTFNDDVTADYFNIQAFLEDAAFVAGQQWDPVMANQRILDQKPTLTINTAPALIAQVMGNRFLNETAVKVLPDMGGTREVAKVRQGLIRSIEKISNGDRAYDTAMQNSVIGGIGNFRIVPQYAANDVFEQELAIKPIPNPGAVIWDRMRQDPTGRDAKHVFVQDLMLRTEFEARWPWAQPGELGSTLAYTQMLQTNGWVTVDTVRVVDYYRMCAKKRTIAMLLDGSIVDVTEKPVDEWLADVAVHPVSGLPIMREALRTYCEMVKCSATDVLEGPFRYWTSRVLVFRVPGWEINVGDTWNRFGLIRFAKDPMRYRNFFKSVKAEKLMQTPKATWLATQESVAGHEDKFRYSNLSNDPLLMWNGETGQKPERIEPAQLEMAMIQEVNEADQDIRNVTNLHESSLGQQGNEVSGKAINARVRVGELGTVIYQHNLNLAIGECGGVLNELIPYYYDTPRTIKTLGEDGKSELQSINDPSDPASIDITRGKYQVTVTYGPAYTTKRVEAVETLETLINAHPEIMGWAGDLLFENMDIPGAEALAKRAAKLLPPGMRDVDEMSPEEQEQMQQAEAAAAKAAEEQSQLIQNQILEGQAKVEEWAARALESEARRELILAQKREVEARTGKTAAGIPAEELKADKTEAEIDKIRAETAVEIMAAEQGFEDAEKKTVVSI